MDRMKTSYSRDGSRRERRRNTAMARRKKVKSLKPETDRKAQKARRKQSWRK